MPDFSKDEAYWATLQSQALCNSHRVISALLTIDYEVIKSYDQERLKTYLLNELVTLQRRIVQEIEFLKDEDRKEKHKQKNQISDRQAE